MDQQKQQPAAVADKNLIASSTKAGDNTSEVLLQLFDQTEKYVLT